MFLIPAGAWTRTTPLSVTIARSFCSHSALRFLRQAATCRQRHSIVVRHPKYHRPAILNSHVRAQSQSRSYWGRRGGFGGLWGRRTRSFWHKPGCKWVVSEGDPRSSPRDPECPACQEEQNLPYELSAREILWQRQQQMMEEWIKKDPYDALFGRSNDMLKGILRRSIWSPWVTHDTSTLGQKAFRDTTQDIRSPATTELDSYKQTEPDPLASKEDALGSTRNKSLNFPSLVSEQAKAGIESTSTKATSSTPITSHVFWKLSGVENGTRYEASGELEYDPVSGRMKPRSPQQNSKLASASSSDGSKLQTSIERRDIKETTESVANTSMKADAPKENDYTLTNLRPSRRSPPSSLQLSTGGPRINEIPHSLAKSETSRAVAAKPHSSPSTSSNHVTVPTMQPSLLLPNEVKNHKHRVVKAQGWKAAKEALETSWAQEHNRQQKQKEQIPACNSLAAPRNMNSAVYELLTRKCQPIKHMTSGQLANHRRQLLSAWMSKRSKSAADESPAKSATDKILDEEVAAQKFAMATLENKQSSSTKVTTNTTNEPKEDTSNSSYDNVESKPAFIGAEGDICVNAPKYASLNRLYKKKALHAVMKEENQAEDRSLVRAVREIYEKAYGPITTQHRQGTSQLLKQDCETEPELTPSSMPKANIKSRPPPVELQPQVESLASKTRPARRQQVISDTIKARSSNGLPVALNTDPDLYLVLAHDPDTGAMYTATASSSFQTPTAEETLSASDALIKLSNPAKFLSHFAQHQAAGYEIVSANKNLLVFKKLRIPENTVHEASLGAEIATPPEEKKATRINPIDGTSQSREQAGFIRTTTGNYASPTGFVNHELPQTQQRETIQQPSSVPGPGNPRVNRTEAVFSGQLPLTSKGNGHGGNRPGNGRFGGRKNKRGPVFRVLRRAVVAVRKMLLIGLCMGVLLYGLGAFIENKTLHGKPIELSSERTELSENLHEQALQSQSKQNTPSGEQSLEEQHIHARRKRLEKMRERRETEKEDRRAERRRRRREHQKAVEAETRAATKDRRELPAKAREPRVMGLTADEMAATSLLLAGLCAVPLLWIWTGNR